MTPSLRDAPRDVVPGPWRRLVLGPDSATDRRAYTLCVMERLQDTLRRRDVFVPGSEHWGDLHAALLQGARGEAMRPQICRALCRQDTPEPELHLLTAQLDAAYRRTVANFPTNAAPRACCWG
jgi:hypothetical protein